VCKPSWGMKKNKPLNGREKLDGEKTRKGGTLVKKRSKLTDERKMKQLPGSFVGNHKEGEVEGMGCQKGERERGERRTPSKTPPPPNHLLPCRRHREGTQETTPRNTFGSKKKSIMKGKII